MSRTKSPLTLETLEARHLLAGDLAGSLGPHTSLLADLSQDDPTWSFPAHRFELQGDSFLLVDRPGGKRQLDTKYWNPDRTELWKLNEAGTDGSFIAGFDGISTDVVPLTVAGRTYFVVIGGYQVPLFADDPFERVDFELWSTDGTRDGIQFETEWSGGIGGSCGDPLLIDLTNVGETILATVAANFSCRPGWDTTLWSNANGSWEQLGEPGEVLDMLALSSHVLDERLYFRALVGEPLWISRKDHTWFRVDLSTQDIEPITNDEVPAELRDIDTIPPLPIEAPRSVLDARGQSSEIISIVPEPWGEDQILLWNDGSIEKRPTQESTVLVHSWKGGVVDSLATITDGGFSVETLGPWRPLPIFIHHALNFGSTDFYFRAEPCDLFATSDGETATKIVERPFNSGWGLPRCEVHGREIHGGEVGSQALVFAFSPTVNEGLVWITDGTKDGTSVFTETASEVVFMNDRSYFVNEEGELNYISSTLEIISVPLPQVESIKHGTLREFNHELVFFDREKQLWRTDGDSAEPINGLPQGVMPAAFVDGRWFFAAYDLEHGLELWSSDGMTEGTQLAADIYPGPGSSLPQDFVFADDRLYFSADDGVHGREPWQVDLSGLDTETEQNADIDGDGNVTFADFLLLSNNFGNETDRGKSDGDLDDDGIVAFSDFLILAAQFQTDRT